MDHRTFIGQSSPPPFARPAIPNLPSLHIIYWTNPPAGAHLLSARSQLSFKEWASAPPVQITVDSETVPTVVSIQPTQPIAEETSWPLRRLQLRGVFTISRKGPTTTSLPVYLQYSGTATPGEDYPFLPWRVSIPAGAVEVQIRIEPTIDNLPEPIETLIATVSNCPPPTDDKPELDEAQRILREEADRREALFRASFEAEKTRGDALAKRFEEALKQARDEPVTRPARDFDLD